MGGSPGFRLLLMASVLAAILVWQFFLKQPAEQNNAPTNVAQEAASASATALSEPATLTGIIEPARKNIPQGCADFHGFWRDTPQTERWLTIYQSNCDWLLINFHHGRGPQKVTIGKTLSYETGKWKINATYSWVDKKKKLYVSFNNFHEDGLKCYGHQELERIKWGPHDGIAIRGEVNCSGASGEGKKEIKAWWVHRAVSEEEALTWREVKGPTPGQNIEPKLWWLDE